MKTNSTFLRYAILFICVLCLSTVTKATPPGYNFTFSATPVPMQASNNYNIGNKFKFVNVATGTDAIVTIVSATGGATVDKLDDNSTTMPEAFSPQIKVPGTSTGLVEFKIEFVVTGTTTPKLVDTLKATAMDIDGNATLHELDALDMGTGSILSYLTSTLQINVVPTLTQYLATNIAGVEYSGVDTTAKQVMFTLTRTSISSFTYKAGAINLSNSSTSRQKGIYFKGFNYNPAATLAVRYTAFDAVVVDKAVVLKWITEIEIDHNHFEVERSFDGTNFTTIGIVLDGFANGSFKNYQFKDNSDELQTKTVVYYRLKQVDNSGKYSYTNTLAVKLKAAEGVAIQTSPNPFVENLNVRFTAAANGNAEIAIINGNGQQVVNKQNTISKGYNTVQLNGLSSLAPGMYIVRVSMNGVVVGTQKIIKN